MLWRLLTMVAILWGFAAEARVVQPIKLRYKTETGRSRWYDVDATFMTGVELNQATTTLNFDGLSSYVVVFWAENQASVIKMKPMVPCGYQFTSACMPILGNWFGVDQEGRQWEVCGQSMCF